MKTNKRLFAVLATAAVIGLSGCGSSSDSSNTAPTPSSSEVTTSSSTKSSTPESESSTPPATQANTSDTAAIVIKDFAYEGPATVAAGAKVTVTNADSETHTLTSDESGQFDVNVTAGGKTATFTAPTEPGSYPYHCTFHSDMHGVLVVK